ncbi:MAG: DNA repair and recombination protein RadB [Halobacteriota archaeon]|nr:DNA repair and recombination protein RadB [Halobacteriota archaeon]
MALRIKKMNIKRYPLGCSNIDRLLGGGFEAGTVTQIYGEAGSGKTNISLQLTIECVRSGKKVIFIDTEGISIERFNQIAGDDAELISRDIIIFEPMSFDQQYSIIREIDRMVEGNVGLVILDSATLFYRYELEDERSISLKRELAHQVAHLLGLARRHDIAVVITNQVYTDLDKNELHPVGGTMLAHLSKVIIHLEKLDYGKRRAVIRKHRSMPEGSSCEFLLTGEGVKNPD